MAKNKLNRFREIKTLDRYYESLRAPSGNWNSRVFKNDNPITLELGCGYGEYTIALSEMYSEKNFIGVDVKANRMYVGVRDANLNNRENAAFLRTYIEFINRYFQPSEVDEIWITFPDPHLKKIRPHKRLTSRHSLKIYRKLLKPGGLIHLKTDNDFLYEFTLDVLKEEKERIEIVHNFPNVYETSLLKPEWLIKTRYEYLFSAKGMQIKLLTFKLF